MKPRVLVIDDDDAILQSCEAILEDAGHEVHLASRPESGLAMLRRQTFDLALIDFKLPGMNGFEVASALRADSATERIPILILTAKDLTDADKASLNGHVSRVLRKGSKGTAELLAWLQGQAPGMVGETTR